MEFTAGTVSEVLSMAASSLFMTGSAPLNYEFTIKLQWDLNHALRKVYFPIKSPSQVLWPVDGTTGAALAQSEFELNVKHQWYHTTAVLSDSNTTADNDNSQSDQFGPTVLLLLAVLFKRDNVRLPAEAGHDSLRLTDLLAAGTSVVPDALRSWLTDSNLPGSFAFETFTANQFGELLDSIDFQSRYRAYAHSDEAVALEEVPAQFGQLYYVCPYSMYIDGFQQYHWRSEPLTPITATSDGRLATKVPVGVLGLDVLNSGAWALLSDLPGQSYLVESTQQVLYFLRCYRTQDPHGYLVLVSDHFVDAQNRLVGADAGAPVLEPAGNKWCKQPRSAGGYLQDSKGVVLAHDWYDELPGNGTRCWYDPTADNPMSYAVCTIPVYAVEGGYYTGSIQSGFDVRETEQDGFLLGSPVLGVVGCSDSEFPVGGAEIWQVCPDPANIRTWKNPASGVTYHDSDVYVYRDGRTYAGPGVQVRFLGEPGFWTDSDDRKYPENHVLGGVCALEVGDSIGIVVDLRSDTAGLNKILPVRLLIQHQETGS